MNTEYYSEILKRKSFHLFRNVGDDIIEEAELEEIKRAYASFDSLCPDIKTAIRIVPADKVNFKRDAQYCILIYSERKDNYLVNVGYIGEQLDLWLVRHNIGSLWYGIGKPDAPTCEGLDYVIMIAVHKVSDPAMYRKDMFKAKRKPVEEIWSGDRLGIAEIVRFSPSACNTQPWFAKNDSGVLTVFRYRKEGKRGIMPAKAVAYYNRIDIGIFLCILEICMAERGIVCDREIFVDNDSGEYNMIARYSITANPNLRLIKN